MYVVDYGRKLAIYKFFMQVFNVIVEKYVVNVYNLLLTRFIIRHVLWNVIGLQKVKLVLWKLGLR